MIRFASALLLLLSLPAVGAAPDSEQGVVEEAWALERDPVLRPAHVDPALSGTFEEGFAPWAEALNASADRLKDKADREALAEHLDRGGPIPERWQAEVVRSTTLLDGALGATHRSGARLPPGMRLGGFFGDARPGSSEFQHLARLAMLDARLASERGDHTLALRRCADVLALARDFSRGALVMALVGKGISHRPFELCPRFASRASLAERRRFLDAVARIRAGWGPPSAVLRHERLFGQLLFATRFSEKARAALPPALEPVVKMGPESRAAGGVLDWLFGGMARKSIFQRMTGLMEAADRPPAEGDPVIIRIEAEVPASMWLAGMGDSVREASWLRMIRGLRTAEARLALLQSALAAQVFHAERGAWPKAWTDLFPAGAPLDPRTGRALALELASAEPRVRAEADSAREAEELSLSLGGR